MNSDTSSLVFLQYLTTVFDNIAETILLVAVEQDGAYRLLMANEAFARNTGHPKDVAGKLVSEIVSPKSYKSLLPRYDKVVATRESLEYTEWYEVPLGCQAYDSKIIPILNAVGECVQLAVITRNVTELEHLRRQVAQLAKAPAAPASRGRKQ